MTRFVAWVVIGQTTWPVGVIVANSQQEAMEQARETAEKEHGCQPDSVHAVPSVYQEEPA